MEKFKNWAIRKLGGFCTDEVMRLLANERRLRNEIGQACHEIRQDLERLRGGMKKMDAKCLYMPELYGESDSERRELDKNTRDCIAKQIANWIAPHLQLTECGERGRMKVVKGTVFIYIGEEDLVVGVEKESV